MPSGDRAGSSTRCLAIAGSVACVILVVAATRAGPPAGTAPPPGPFGLWRPAPSGRVWFAALAALAVCALAVVFLRLYRRAVTGDLSAGAVARTVLPWYVPVLLSSPLLSLDAYSYAAQGWLLLSDLDPYTAGPARLGGGPVVDAVAPVWRDTPAPYGPLSLVLLRAVATWSGADLAAAVYLLRLVAVLGVVATAAAALRLADPSRRAAALALVVANPLVVVHLVGGVHLDALLSGLAGVTVLAVRQRWWTLAALGAATAFAVKLPGLVLVGYVMLSRLRNDGAFSRRLWATVATVVAAVLGYAALVPNGWGWVATLDVPGRIHHPYDPATGLGWLLHLGTHATGLPVEFPAALRTARAAALVTGAVAVFVLIWRAARSPVRPSAAVALVGGALLTVALAAPAIHPWYAVWGLALVAAAATPRAQWWMVGLSVALCFTALPDPLARHPLGLALIIGLAAAAVAGVRVAAEPGTLQRFRRFRRVGAA